MEDVLSARLLKTEMIVCLILLELVAFASSKDYARLSVPQVLLPYSPSGNSQPTYTLHGLAYGCYTWTSSNPDVIPITPLFENNGQRARGCANSAIITTNAVGPARQSALILAEDVSGEILQSNVAVDKIARIEILSTSRLLLLGQAPAIYYVKAYDKIGNVFSNVSSFSVDWFLSNAPNSTIDASNVLRIISQRDSRHTNGGTICIQHLIDPSSVANSVLVEGINTGSAILSARLADAAFKNILPSRLKIQVSDNVVLVPSDDIYILVGAQVHFQVFRLIQEQQREVKFPSELYFFDVSNNSVIELKEVDSVVTAIDIGVSVVSLIDKNIQHSHVDYRPNCEVHVVEPAYLGFTVLPDRVWALERNRIYVVIIDVYDRESNRIQISEGTVIKSVFPEDYFSVMYSTRNGSYYQVKAIQDGNVTITASLSQIWLPAKRISLDLEHAVTGDQEVHIFKPIVLHPSILVFPWAPNIQLDCNYKLRVSGGSGSYYWSTIQANVATVNTKGLVKARNLGQTIIKATDVRNSNHFSKAEVYVSSPDGMAFISPFIETPVGNSLLLELKMWTIVDNGRKLNFILCDDVPINLTSSDSKIFTIDTNRLEGNIEDSCLSVAVHCISSGSAKLFASYSSEDSGMLVTEEVVTCFDPLQIVDPPDTAVVSLFSSVLITSVGGPTPRSFDRNSHFEVIIPAESDQVTNELLSPKDAPSRLSLATDNVHVHRVTCLQLGKQELVISVGNNGSVRFLHRVYSSSTLRFVCTIPTVLQLEPSLKFLPEFEVIPCYQWLEDKTLQYPIRNDQVFPIRISLTDSQGHYFNNFSSLQILWRSENQDLVQLENVSHYDWVHNHTSVAAVEGIVSIQASVDGYKNESKISFIAESAKLQKLQVSIALQLLFAPHISPTAMNVFNHLDVVEDFTILHGSGHFRVSASATNMNLTKTSSSKLQLAPLSEGTTTISVVDLCLDMDTPVTTSVIRISNLFGIEVQTSDLVEKGGEILARVKLIDSSGCPLSARYLDFIKLLARSSSKNVEITFVEISKSEYGDAVVYKLRGNIVGYATLTWLTLPADVRLSLSQSKEIYVFPPMTVSPQKIVLIPSAEVQILYSGGPPTQAQVIFQSVNQTIATVDNKGLVVARAIGETFIEVVMQSIDTSNRKIRIYSRTTVSVIVTKMTGVKIFASINRLVTGTTLSVYAVGLSDETPFTFASAAPGIKFNWMSSNDEVVSLSSVYSQSGINYEDESDFAVRVSTRNAGECHVTLVVSQYDDVSSKYFVDKAILSAEQKFEVFTMLQVSDPIVYQLQLPYNCEKQIRTNLDDIAKLNFAITGDPSIITVDNQGRISTGKDAGKADIVISSEDKLGLNQSVVINLEVKPVIALSIGCLSTLRITTTNQTHKFPVGATVKFRVNLFDFSGRRFDDVRYPLEYRLSRFDVIHISPGTNNNDFILKTIGPGQVIWHVWDSSSPGVGDFVRISVDHAIVPRSFYVLPGFSVSLKTALTKHPAGTWLSDNGEIVEVDSDSGTLTAIKPGSAILKYSVEGLLSLDCDVTVRPIRKVLLGEGTSKFVTNVYNGMQFARQPSKHLHVVTLAASYDESNNFSGRMIPAERVSKLYNCDLQVKDNSLDVDEILKVESIVNVTSGLIYCLISPLETDRSIASSVSTIDNLYLELTVFASNMYDGSIMTSNIEKISFVPAFVVSKSNIILTDEHESDIVNVFGIPKQLKNLEVTADPLLSIISLLVGEKEAKFKVTLLKNIDEAANVDMQIKFNSKITRQRNFVTVVYKPPEKSLMSVGKQDNICPETTQRQAIAEKDVNVKNSFSYANLPLFWIGLIYSFFNFWTIFTIVAVIMFLLISSWSNRRYNYYPSVSRARPDHLSSSSPRQFQHSGIASPFRYTTQTDSPRRRYVAKAPKTS